MNMVTNIVNITISISGLAAQMAPNSWLVGCGRSHSACLSLCYLYNKNRKLSSNSKESNPNSDLISINNWFVSCAKFGRQIECNLHAPYNFDEWTSCSESSSDPSPKSTRILKGSFFAIGSRPKSTYLPWFLQRFPKKFRGASPKSARI